MVYKELETKRVYFSTAQVGRILTVPAPSIRWWLSEVDIGMIRRKGRGSHRRFRLKDIKSIAIIKFMVQEEGYTLWGVRKNFNKYGCNDKLNVKRTAR